MSDKTKDASEPPLDCRVRPLAAEFWAKGFWIRVYGYGLFVILRRHHVPLFSERYGYRKAHYIGPLRLEILRPNA